MKIINHFSEHIGRLLPSYKAILRLWVVIFALGLLAGCAPSQATQNTIRITINADGKQVAYQVPAGSTAQNALQQAGIALGNLDRVEPPSYSILADNAVVTVTRVREVYTVQEAVIPFESKRLNNETLPENTELLVQPGVNGREQITYRQVFENDEEVSNTIFKTEVLVEPMPEIKMIGVQKPFTPVAIPGKIVYLTSGNAWMMETTTGNRRPVVTTGDLDGNIFSLSPKGDWLLFSRAEKTDAEAGDGQRINTLWAVDLTEEDSRPVNLKIDNVKHFAAWVPGKGLTITYSTVEPRSTAPGWQANNDLTQVTFATTGAIVKEEKILETNMGGLYGWWGTDFAWSPDGSLLAYARPDEVGVVDLETKTLKALASILPFQTGQNWAWVPGIAWSPDHNVLYMVTHEPSAEFSGSEMEQLSPIFNLSGLPVATGPLISIVPEVGMFAYPVTSPALAAGGYRVAFLQSREPRQSDTRPYRLGVMDRDGSNRQIIFPAEDLQGLEPQRVAWSPTTFDNGHLWVAVNYQGNLWLVDAETGEGRQVTGDGLINRIDWR
jgi:Tol biopolymer transport system component